MDAQDGLGFHYLYMARADASPYFNFCCIYAKERPVSGESSGENPVEIFQILTVIDILSFCLFASH